jgi:hypothetical protein
MLDLRGITGPYNGLEAKIKFIKDCYRKSLTDPRVRRYAEQWAGRGDRRTQASNLYTALQHLLVYLPDPVGVEMTKSPSVMLDQMEGSYNHTIQGDCDDMSCLGYAMLMSIGMPTRLRVTWYGKSSMPQHIYLITFPTGSGAPVPFDLTRRDKFGSEIPYTRKMDF